MVIRIGLDVPARGLHVRTSFSSGDYHESALLVYVLPSEPLPPCFLCFGCESRVSRVGIVGPDDATGVDGGGVCARVVRDLMAVSSVRCVREIGVDESHMRLRVDGGLEDGKGSRDYKAWISQVPCAGERGKPTAKDSSTDYEDCGRGLVCLSTAVVGVGGCHIICMGGTWWLHILTWRPSRYCTTLGMQMTTIRTLGSGIMLELLDNH